MGRGGSQRRKVERTTCIASPRITTRLLSEMILGFVSRKYAAVRWKSEIARMSVKAEMTAMIEKDVGTVLWSIPMYILCSERERSNG